MAAFYEKQDRHMCYSRQDCLPMSGGSLYGSVICLTQSPFFRPPLPIYPHICLCCYHSLERACSMSRCIDLCIHQSQVDGARVQARAHPNYFA